MLAVTEDQTEGRALTLFGEEDSGSCSEIFKKVVA